MIVENKKLEKVYDAEDIQLLNNNPKMFWRNIETISAGTFYGREELISITIPHSIIEIGDSCFRECINLKEVFIPDSISSIEYSCFRDCESLEKVVLPMGLISIGNFCFSGCKKLKTIVIPKGVINIGYGCFSGCENLEAIVIPSSVVKFGEGCFEGCCNLKTIVLPEGITNIGYECFKDCENLKRIIIPDSVTTFGSMSFDGCNNLEKINIPEGVTAIGDQCFSGCYSLKKIVIPDSVTNLGTNSFEYCENLTTVVLSNNITTLEPFTFGSCKSLREIVIPNSVTTIGHFCFNDCENLENIVLPNNLKSIGEGCFEYCVNLETIVIPDSVTTIDAVCFHDCYNLKKIVMPDSVTELGGACFDNCTNLETVVLSNNITCIKDDTFADCKGLEKIDIPSSVTSIGNTCFGGCKNLKEIVIPSNVSIIGRRCFMGCSNLEKVEISNDTIIGNEVFNSTNIKYIYSTIDGKRTIFSSIIDPELERIAFRKNINIDRDSSTIVNQNYRKNLSQLVNWKSEKKIQFIPPDYVLTIFPSSEMKNFYLNKNNHRWGRLIRTIEFDKIEGAEKNNSLEDLMKIYYALGGFSENQGESEKAFDYIVKYVAVGSNEKSTPNDIGANIHSRFSEISLSGQFNPEFAKFFMKYYKDNPYFMNFQLKDRYGKLMDMQDYLCFAHNSFSTIIKAFPNRRVNGNEERALLTPKFIAEHSSTITYNNVNQGNELLAETIGRYGYEQKQFERIQDIYERAKKVKDSYVIKANKLDEEGISFRILDKDDPLGFVIGKITNCCQVIEGAASTCVDDGYTNPNAGFLVFEENIMDEKGIFTGEKRILGQAYIWYDPITKTICYDNIEIPTKVLEELRDGSKNKRVVSFESFMDAVEKSAEAIMLAMNREKIMVERVTTGESYNDLKKELFQKFGDPQKNPKAKHRNYSGYSDALVAQFVIKNYDEVTKKYGENIRSKAKEIKDNLDVINKKTENINSNRKAMKK